MQNQSAQSADDQSSEANSSALGVKADNPPRTAQCDSGVPDKKNYTLKEAAIYLNVSTRTVERLIQRRLLRRNKALRKILIPRSELESFLQRTL
jgi:excisionase family DNA binding protein